MKTFIKTSYILALLIGILSIGLGTAFANNGNTDKTVKKTPTVVKKTNVVPLRCKMQAKSSSITKSVSGCTPSSTTLPSGQYVVTPDCHLLLIKDGKVTVLI